ncbi:MAG: VWA domain-containing protein [Acidimicrobiales bacterium]
MWCRTASWSGPILTLIRSDIPMVADLDLSQVGIAASQQVTTPVDADIVLGAERAPLLVLTDGADGKMAYLAFELDQSTLPLQAAFPVLFDRLVSDVAELVSPSRLVVGADLPIDPQLAAITSPSGTSEEIPPGYSYPAADAVGFWQVEQAGRPVLTIAVGIERAESVIAPAPDLPFEAAFEGTALGDQQSSVPWRTVPILVLLAVLIAEALLARRRRGWVVASGRWPWACGADRCGVAGFAGHAGRHPVGRFATMFLIDASDSMGPAGAASAVGLVREALEAQPEGDLAGVVVFGSDARLEQLVRNEPSFANVSVTIDPSGTDLSAALRLGAAALPNDARKRLVLISDGRATTGDVDDEISPTGRQRDPGRRGGGRYRDRQRSRRCRCRRAVARSGRRAGVDRRPGVGPAAGPAVVTLSRDGETVETRTVDLEAGENTLRFTDVATDEGVLRYQATIDAVGDSVAANDVGYARSPSPGPSASSWSKAVRVPAPR